MFRLFAITILALSFSNNAIAEQTGNDLLRGCNAIIAKMENRELATEDIVLSVFWTGYIAGYIDNGVLNDSISKTKGYCIPDQGIENGQAAMVIANYLKKNPNQLHESARLCLFLALADAFKCD